MGSRKLNVAEAFEAFAEPLKLSWQVSEEGGKRQLTRDAASGQRPRLLGPLNFNSPNRIQILGASEVRLFSDQAVLDQSRFEYELEHSTDLFIVTDSLPTPPAIVTLAMRESIPVFQSKLGYSELQKSLRYLLMQHLANRQIVHGVMMDVHGTGVLITGDASVGKSELALELISRGHILVADDAPEFTRIAPGTLECECPTLLQDFLEVRGIGVLNIALMYGHAHTRPRKILRFIVHLQQVDPNVAGTGKGLADLVGDRISKPSSSRNILDVEVPERTIPVAPGRNLAVLIEAAVRDQILLEGGYSASEDLVRKQAQAMQDAQG